MRLAILAENRKRFEVLRFVWRIRPGWDPWAGENFQKILAEQPADVLRLALRGGLARIRRQPANHTRLLNVCGTACNVDPC